jgi:hypothetical protein
MSPFGNFSDMPSTLDDVGSLRQTRSGADRLRLRLLTQGDMGLIKLQAADLYPISPRRSVAKC